MKYMFKYNTFIGDIYIVEENQKIINIWFNNEKNDYIIKETDLIKKTIKQIKEYLLGKRKLFDIEYELKGTKFQLKVYNELLKISYGSVCSYKEIAFKIGSDKGYRAVGNVNNKNPLPIIIPCHRVIGSNNSLVGYAGGLEIKKILLEIENKNK